METLSAFANGDGGTILLGLDEHAGFLPAQGFRAGPVRDALITLCSTMLTPTLRVPIEIEEFEGASVVRADIPEVDPIEKPCFVTARGEYQGSFIRSGDGDMHLTRYEVTQLLGNRTQPLFDIEPIDRASMSDLDGNLVDAVVRRVRRRSPRTFADLDTATALIRLGAATRLGAQVKPTLAGLLCLGLYPQQFFPQLFVSFVALPGASLGDANADGTRFLDNVKIDGPLPQMVAQATAALVRNIRSASVVRGVGREDRYDYPIEVFRELIVNAVMHRDYSPSARGTQVHVELYPDRLVVKSPGGIHGSTRVDDLGTDNQVSSSRNATLAQLLSDVELPDEPGRVVSENRGSGLPRVVISLRQAGMSPPAFDARPGQLTVTVPQHALLSVDVIDWISTLGLADLSNAQHLALAIMRTTGRVTNAMLQAWGVDRIAAGAALRNLVERDVVTVSGGKRYASYRLVLWPTIDRPAQPALFESEAAEQPGGIAADLDAIRQAIRAGHTTTRDIGHVLDMPYHTVVRRLRVLRESGEVATTRPRNSKSQSYQLTEQIGL